MKILVYTASLGGIDQLVAPVPQPGIPFDYVPFTDVDFPPRPHGLSRRLQARIPKIFGWDLRPGYDVYIWLDGSLRMTLPDAIAWYLAQLGDRDIAVFAHPHRSTLRDEIDFVRTKLSKGSRYLQIRYEGEDLSGLEHYVAQQGLLDLPLFASTSFIYRPSERMKGAMKDWWGLTARYHSIDQIQLSVVLHQWSCTTQVIDEDIYHASHLHFEGHRARI